MGYYSVGKLGNNLANAKLELGKSKDFQGADGAVDILLVGSDSRTDAQGNPLTDEELARLNAGTSEGELNTDTIILVRVPNDGSRATAVSIPRDTYVKDRRFGNSKINGIYGQYADEKREELVADGMSEGKKLEEYVSRAAQQGLVNAVSDLTGVEIDHYAQVGLLGFVLLTDAVGGVEVCLNEAVNEPLSGANFPAGYQTLNGTEALAFVRQRHDLPRGDLDRIVRQQAFMASLTQKVLSAGTLGNPNRLRELSTAVERSVVVDSGWDIMSMASQLSDLAAGNVTFATIPVTSANGVGDYGESIVTVDPNQVHAFMNDLSDGVQGNQDGQGGDDKKDAKQDDNPFAGHSITLLNAGTIEGQAASVAGFLRKEGVDVGTVSNAEYGLYSQSQILAADAEDPVAKKLAEKLGGLPVVADASLDSISYVVVTADDYTGPLDEASIPPASEEDVVGTPGDDFGAADAPPEFNAGGGPRCIN
nr:LCP family protein [Corynebacterium aquatimens]